MAKAMMVIFSMCCWNFANIVSDDSVNVPSQRKPLTGRLTIRIHSVADVDHAATGRFSRGPETFVVVKVEDNIKARTKGTRNGRFEQEVHEIDVDKANEVELTVYDRNGDSSMPIGMLWIRISDIVEEMRRKKIESEFNSSGWATAPGQGGNQGQQGQQGQQGPGGPRAGVNPLPPPAGPIFITAWFAVEPVGRIQLTLGFRMSSTIDTLEYLLIILNSQAKPKQANTSTWTWTSRCYASKKRGSPRAIWPQVCSAAILQYHAMRALWRITQVCCWHAMC